MKKFKVLFVLLAAFFILPFAVFAEGEEEATENTETAETTEATETTENEESKEVKIYFFRGEGCPHCQEAEEWFKSIEEEYGSFFEIVDYETWQDEKNAELMQQVAEARKEKAEGVPYIIIGDKSWNGFTESYEEEMIDQIKKVFEQPVSERYDIMKYLGSDKKAEEKNSSNDVLTLIIILSIVGIFGFGIYKLRDSSNE